MDTTQIRMIAPNAKDDIMFGIVGNADLFPKYAVTAPHHLAYFFGRVAVETAGLTELEENLYYTTAGAMRRAWPSRFPSDASCTPYLRNPKALANLTYGGRMGNEHNGTKDDDGWLYRGSGLFNTTGYDQYLAVERATGQPVTQHPDLLRSFPLALESALVFWRDNHLARFADKSDVAGLCKAIQGGTAGLDQQRVYTDRATRAFGANVIAMPSMRLGSTGANVTWLQTRLVAIGYELDVDGNFGRDTLAAVKDFQEKHSLTVDGVAGANTQRALKNVE